MNTTDSVGKQTGYRNDGALTTFLLIRNRVCENHFFKSTFFHTLGCGVTHNGMRAKCTHRFRACLFHKIGGLGDSTGGIHHIVDKNYILALHIADYSHFGYNICLGTLFMAKHQRHIKILGIAVGSLCTAHVGSCYHRVGELEALYVWDEHRRGIEVVYRHIEKPLDLGLRASPW